MWGSGRSAGCVTQNLACPKLIIHLEKADSKALTDIELLLEQLAHILEAQLTKGRVSNSPCYKAETWDNSFCETPKALALQKNNMGTINKKIIFKMQIFYFSIQIYENCLENSDFCSNLNKNFDDQII